MANEAGYLLSVTSLLLLVSLFPVFLIMDPKCFTDIYQDVRHAVLTCCENKQKN